MKKGDMAWSLLRMFSSQLAMQAWTVATDAGLKDVIFCGNFVSPKIVRDWVVVEVMKRTELAKFKGVSYTIYW